MTLLVPPRLASAVDREPFTTIMSHDPVAYWPMDDASGDVVNYGSLASKDGADFGSPAYQQTAIVPRGLPCVEFDGTTDYFQVTDAVITGNDPEFTLGFWIATNGGASQRTVFQQQDTTSSYTGFRVYTNSNTLVFQAHHTDGTSKSLTVFGLNTYLNNNTPFFFAIVGDETHYRAYVNGAQVANTTRNTVEWVSGSDCFIGRAETTVRYWVGKISDVFVLDHALTSTELDNLWRKGEYQIERPLGDHFKDALPLTVDTPITSTAVGASSAPEDPTGTYGATLPRSIWAKFVPPTDDPFIVDLVGPASPLAKVTMYGYVGDDDLEDASVWTEYSSVVNILNVDDSPHGRKAINATPIAAGQAYYFNIGVQNNGLLNPGGFTFEVQTFPAPPANDDFADAQTIDVSTAGSVTGSTVGASIEDSQEAVSTNCAEHSVWYTFVADATGIITFDTCDGGDGEYQYYGLAAWDATADAISVVGDIDWTTPLDSDYSSGNSNSGCGEITISVVSGNTYYLHVVNLNLLPDQDPFTLTWTDIT